MQPFTFKKTGRALILIVLISVSNGVLGQLFVQDFSSSSTVSDYVSASPDNSKFTSISSTGAGTVFSIVSDKLSYTRTSSNTGSFSRTADFSPTPTTLQYKLSISVSGNTAATTSAAVFQVGSGYGTTNSAEANADTYARFALNFTATNGDWTIRDITNGNNSGTLTGSHDITWVLNNSGSTLTYLGPNNIYETLLIDKADIWAGTTKIFDDVNIQTPSQSISDLKFAFTTGSGTITVDNFYIDPVPIVWLNNQGNNNWSTSTNWGQGLVPTNSQNVIIPSGGDQPKVSNEIVTPATVNDLTINSGAIVTIDKGKALTVARTLTNNAGASGLVIESDATGTGSLIHNTDNVEATSHHYVPGVSYAWHLTGSPVVAQSISGDWIPGGTGYDFYAYDEPTATWLNQKVGGNNITSFTPGKGYLTAYESVLPTKLFSGNLNNGTVTVPVTKTGSGPYTGANLLSNPYASGIDWSSATRTLFADNFAYVYDQTAGGGAGGYTTINGGAGDAWIAPHQGFFVIAQAAGDFSFIHAMREHGGTFTKNVAADLDVLSIRLSGETYFDVTSIRQKENTSANRDRDDALKFYSFNTAAPQLYTLSQDGEKLMLNSFPELDNETAVNVGMLIPVEGSYNISIESVSGLLTSEDIYLEDKLLGTNHNLSINGAYSFVSSPSDNPNRFILHFGAVGIGEQTPSSKLKAYMLNGQLYFHQNGEAVMEVIDLQGRLLESAVVNGQGLVNRQMNQPAGVYVIRLTDSEVVQTAKVVVK